MNVNIKRGGHWKGSASEQTNTGLSRQRENTSAPLAQPHSAIHFTFKKRHEAEGSRIRFKSALYQHTHKHKTYIHFGTSVSESEVKTMCLLDKPDNRFTLSLKPTLKSDVKDIWMMLTQTSTTHHTHIYCICICEQMFVYSIILCGQKHPMS